MATFGFHGDHGQMNRYRKFGSVMTTVDGIKFRSKAEAKRYGELKMLEKARLIRNLVLQPRYPLHAGTSGPVSLVGTYVADFAYLDANNAQVVEDVKGFKTDLYRWKKKHVEAQYGITVTEITK